MDDPKDHNSGERDLNAEALDRIHGDEAAQIEAEKAQKALYADIHATFSTEAGQRTLEWMNREWGGRTFHPDNARVDAFNQGSRQVVLVIEEVLNQVNGGEL